MNVISRRVVSIAALILLAVGLTACGDSEADQRKAFTAFLEEINHRAGVHFLRPKPEEEKAFGPYLRHYAVITDFNKDMNATADDYDARLKKRDVDTKDQAHSLEQMVARRTLVPIVKEETIKFVQDLEARLAKANAERSALQQPDDLKAVYNVTYNKLITAPTQAMVNSNKGLIEISDSSMRLVDYLADHRDKVTVTGSQMRATDPKTLAEVNALLKAHQEVYKRFQDMQRDSGRVLSGT